MRVAFFLDNKKYYNVDFSKPERGNPGVRGTQYMIWAVACGLSSMYNDIDVVLFANNTSTMPAGINFINASDEIEALTISKKLGIDVFVLRTSISTNENVFKKLTEVNIPCITWSHNFEDYYLAEMISNTPQIKKNVCVGRQQYERLCDHKVFNKSTYIYNALQFDCYQIEKNTISDRHIVTYVGMLDSSKGFHRLARIWKKVLRQDSRAELHVIGTGRLGSDSKLGPLGLADEKYEKKLSKYICNKQGKILPSIFFHGDVGGDSKLQLMSQSKVGIANPTGIGETFCIVAVEFEALGIPVISAKKGGLLDTVENGKDGILSNSDRGLVNAIVKLLNDDTISQSLGKHAKESCRRKFDFLVILDEWYSLFHNIDGSTIKDGLKNIKYPFNQGKIFRFVNKQIKTLSIFSNLPSFLEYDYKLRKTAKRLISILNK